jgi:hypothetical protein
MNIALFVLWATVGWCGNEPRPVPWKPQRDPGKPQPEPWWWGVAGAIGGIGGGLAYSNAWSAGHLETAVYAALTCVGAVVGARIFTTFARAVRGAFATPS